MAQLIGALTVLAEDLGLISSTHMAATTACDSCQGSDTLSGLEGQCTHVMHLPYLYASKNTHKNF